MDISYNKVTRIVWVKSGDKLYHFRLTINGLQELEAVPSAGSPISISRRNARPCPWGHCWKPSGLCSLRPATRTKQECRQVVETLSMDAGIQQVEAIFYVTLAVSGIFGAKQSNEMLKAEGQEQGRERRNGGRRKKRLEGESETWGSFTEYIGLILPVCYGELGMTGKEIGAATPGKSSGALRAMGPG